MNAHSLWLRAKAIVSLRRSEEELSEELSFHIEMQARKHREAGADPIEAMRRARLEFGNVELAKEDARDVRGTRPLEDLVHDVRYAFRAFRRAPTFAVSVMLTIGLGVGINASVFTVFNAYVLRPFEVRDPYSLYSIGWTDRSGHGHDFSEGDYNVLRRPSSSLSDLAAYHTFGARFNGTAATGDAVSENYFSMLGIRAALGRTLVHEDRSAAVVVISHGAWRSRYGGDSTIVGRHVLLHGYPFQIVGVAQPGFEGLFKKPRDFWVPLGMLSALDSAVVSGSPHDEIFSLLGRLGSGVSESQAKAFVGSTLQTLSADLPDSSRVARVLLASRASAIPQSVTTYLAFVPLAAAFGLILLLACANVANMLLARGLARQRELTIRLALGAGRGRLVRQLVTESVVLALPAIGIGFAISWLLVDVGVRALFATLPTDLAAFVRLVPLHPDGRVVAFAFVAAVASAFLSGLVPSLQATRLSAGHDTRGKSVTQPSPRRLRNTLIIGQITISSLLLITASILLREAATLGRMDTGLRTGDVVSVEIQERSRPAVLAALSASPLVDTIAAAATLPLDMPFPAVRVMPSGESTAVDVRYNRVSASYFNVLHIGITNGRGFTAQEERDAAAVAVVSEATAHRLWPNGSPLGQVIHFPTRNTSGIDDPAGAYQNAHVIGIARDAVTRSVDDGTDHPVVYFPSGRDASGRYLLVRVRGDAANTKRLLDADLERAAPGAVDRIDRLETFVAGGIYPFRVAYWVALALGLIALGLTVVGVYGVVAYVVEQRTREIGVRIALGATTRDVFELVLGQSLRQALIGIVIGALIAAGLARILASNIQGMPAFDLVAFAGASLCVVIACMTAAYVPSRRAAQIDPTTALRHD